jgi:hypothetical protein
LNTTTLNTIDQLSVQYVNGIGLVYQNDFDSFSEFFRNIFRNGNRHKNTPAPPVTPSTTTDTPTIPGKPGNTSTNEKSNDSDDQ